MIAVFNFQHGCGRSPGVTFILPGTQKLVVIPVPVLWISRWRERKSRKMKSDPCTTLFHVVSESIPLRRCFRSCIKKNYNLILRKHFVIQFLPVICRVVGKSLFLCHSGKPFVGFVNETDVRTVVLCSKKSQHFEMLAMRGARYYKEE